MHLHIETSKPHSAGRFMGIYGEIRVLGKFKLVDCAMRCTRLDVVAFATKTQEHPRNRETQGIGLVQARAWSACSRLEVHQEGSWELGEM